MHAVITPFKTSQYQTQAAQVGFSLIEALIATVIVALAAFSWILISGNTQQAARSAQMSVAAKDVTAALQTAITNTVRAQSGCLNTSSGLSSLAIGNYGTANLTTQPAMSEGLSLTADWVQAIRRCTNPRSQQNDSTSPAYFCLQFRPQGTPTPGSFLASKVAFAEVYLDNTEVASGAKLSCSAAVNRTSTTVSHLVFTLYWGTAGQGGSTVLKRQTFSSLISL